MRPVWRQGGYPAEHQWGRPGDGWIHLPVTSPNDIARAVQTAAARAVAEWGLDSPAAAGLLSAAATTAEAAWDAGFPVREIHPLSRPVRADTRTVATAATKPDGTPEHQATVSLEEANPPCSTDDAGN